MSDRRIEKLNRTHNVDSFDCGSPELNRFLVRFALQNQQARSSTTYVGLVGDEAIGFYTLVVGSVEHEDAPPRIGKGLSRHPIPIMVLARIAVSKTWQKKGVGSGLLKDAVLRTLQASEIAGIRAIALHAKDEDLRRFYEKFGFVSSPTDPFHMLLLLRDVKASLGIA